MPREFAEAERVVGDEIAIVELFADDHLHHRKRQRGIRSRPDQHDFVGLRSGLCISDIDGDDPGTTLLSGHKMPRCVGLAGEIGSPHDDQLGMRPHVFLGVDLERAGEANAKAAEAPADHRRSPILAAVEVGEAGEHLTARREPVVVGQIAVRAPQGRRFASGCAHAIGD